MREYALVCHRGDGSYSVIFRDVNDPPDHWYDYPGAHDLTAELAQLLVKGLRAE